MFAQVVLKVHYLSLLVALQEYIATFMGNKQTCLFVAFIFAENLTESVMKHDHHTIQL